LSFRLLNGIFFLTTFSFALHKLAQVTMQATGCSSAAFKKDFRPTT
jgi:hypothetical protein